MSGSGRVRAEDVAALREQVRIDDVVGEAVTLRSAGGGSLKGLCPFHEERSPSFHVTSARGLYYCFGCGEGGDVVDFVMKHDHLSFVEAVQRLADRVGMTLRFESGGQRTDRGPARQRLTAANLAAATFFVERLCSDPQAEEARQFLAERGFDEEACARFGVGFAPRSWDSLLGHLRGGGFSDAESLAAGLVSQGQRGTFDRFRGRLMWPIRESSGEVIGFGARKVFADDDGPKYLNTPETALYRKSTVLYGIDLARRAIGASRQVVVVEGYTDVMAAHLAGVATAVATCGTAFGAEHAAILRRYLMDDDTIRGEVIFTFDGDEAGQRAALRAFQWDQRFVAQTFVAVSPDGMDPCDLRLARGDAAVRDLVAGRTPLFAFAIRSALAGFDLATPEGRVSAMRKAAPVVAQIRDTSLRPEYARLLSGWIGLPEHEIRSAVAAAGSASRGGPGATGERGSGARASSDRGTRSPGERRVGASANGPGSNGGGSNGGGSNGRRTSSGRDQGFVQREALKVVLQAPALIADWYGNVTEACFPDTACLIVHQAVVGAGGPGEGSTGLAWMDAVLAACPDDSARALVRQFAVEPLRTLGEADHRYATSIIARLLSDSVVRQVGELKRQLAALDPAAEEARAAGVLADILALEAYRRELATAAEAGMEQS